MQQHRALTGSRLPAAHRVYTPRRQLCAAPSVSLPDTVSNAWKACYYFVAYCLLNTTFTAYSVPYTAIAPELANNHIDRSELVRYRMSFNVIATLISAILQVCLPPAQGRPVCRPACAAVGTARHGRPSRPTRH